MTDYEKEFFVKMFAGEYSEIKVEHPTEILYIIKFKLGDAFLRLNEIFIYFTERKLPRRYKFYEKV